MQMQMMSVEDDQGGGAEKRTHRKQETRMQHPREHRLEKNISAGPRTGLRAENHA